MSRWVPRWAAFSVEKLSPGSGWTLMGWTSDEASAQRLVAALGGECRLVAL